MAAKKMIVTVLAVIAAIVFGNLNQNAYGADEPNAPAEKQERIQHRPRSERKADMGDRVRQQIAELSERLNLTDEQKKAIGPIIENEIKELQALRADTTLSKDEKIEKMKAVRQTAQEGIKKVLTPEQQEKLAEAKAEIKEESKDDIAEAVQRRVEALGERLGLTDEQKQKLQSIFETELKEMASARNDETLSPEQRQEKMKTIRQTSRAEIDKVLTPEQKAKLAEGKKRWRGKPTGPRITDANDKN